MIGIAVLMMSLNERRLVSLDKLLHKAADEIIESSMDDADSLNDGKLVQVQGMTSTLKPLIDERFNIVLE